jgi:pyruvate-formate lyase-activating enzyme
MKVNSYLCPWCENPEAELGIGENGVYICTECIQEAYREINVQRLIEEVLNKGGKS